MFQFSKTLSLMLVLFISAVLSATPMPPIYNFPTYFSYGVASASYEVEGAISKDGRTASIWDVFSETSGKIADQSTGNLAADHYNHLQTDATLLHDLGVSFYSFSLSWSRLFPNLNGKTMEFNQKAADHYSEEIKRLKDNNIQPFVTLFHWDLPQYIQNMGGWLNRSTVGRFVEYSKTCFDVFGPEVTRWITFQDPQQFVWKGYGLGTNAPGRCTNHSTYECPRGNSDTDPYLAAHHILIAHAEVYLIYKTKYQATQKGELGISLNADWPEPVNLNEYEASERHMEFSLGWFADPILMRGPRFGEYPEEMTITIGDRLPVFSESERIDINGSIDFLGLSHFKSYNVKAGVDPSSVGWAKDRATIVINEKLGENGGFYGEGIERVLNWLNDRYYSVPIYIMKNGISDDSSIKEKAVNDSLRIEYHKTFLRSLEESFISDHVNVVGYFAWSFLDGFEWEEGYTKRYGLVYVDRDNDFVRTPKSSFSWYSQVVHSHRQYVPGASPNSLVIWMIILALLLFILSIFLSAYFWHKRRGPQFETVA